MNDAAFVDLVADVRAGREPPETLAGLLAESSAAFADRGAREVARRRGWMLAAFADAGLPDEALPYVLEELDTAREPYVAAAAAMALRAARSWEPRFARHLATAFANQRRRDDAVLFSAFRPDWSTGEPTTALDEILTTLSSSATCPVAASVLAELRADADDPTLSPTVRRRLRETAAMPHTAEAPEPVAASCCSGHATDTPSTQRTSPPPSALAGVRGQDHAGADVDLLSHLTGAVTIVGFFYTRCDNPYKCALTMTKLGEVQRQLTAQGAPSAVQIVGISYDPAYDTPGRLARYARTYRFAARDRDRLIRITDGEEQLRAYFDLQVGYAGTLVNRHGVELHLTGRDARIARSWERALWDVDDVVAGAVALADVTPTDAR